MRKDEEKLELKTNSLLHNLISIFFLMTNIYTRLHARIYHKIHLETYHTTHG